MVTDHLIDLERLANARLDACTPIAKLRDWTKKNPSLPLTLTLAASVACVEPHYLSTLFRRRVGITFGKWNQLRRLYTARAMLDAGERSIDCVVQTLGYRDVRSLRRLVRRYRSPEQKGGLTSTP